MTIYLTESNGNTDWYIPAKCFQTRMYSSRMRTARLLTVSHIIPCILGGSGQPPPPDAAYPPDADPPLDADPPTPWSCDL